MVIFKLGKQFPLTDPGNVRFSLADTFVGQLLPFTRARSRKQNKTIPKSKKTEETKWTLGLTVHKVLWPQDFFQCRDVQPLPSFCDPSFSLSSTSPF